MHCPSCGNDRIKIYGSPMRFDHYDIRTAICDRCKLTFTTKTIITEINVMNPNTLQAEGVEPAKFTAAHREYLLGRAPHPATRGRLD